MVCMIFNFAILKYLFSKQIISKLDSHCLTKRLCEIEHEFFSPVTDIPKGLQSIPLHIEYERQAILKKLHCFSSQIC